MNIQILIDTARELMAEDKGLLAMDESNPTCNKRFAKLGIPQTAEARRAYRELIVTAPGLGESISGAILYDETICQRTNDGVLFAKALSDAGIIPGIKVDAGATNLPGHPGEKITEGLDGLRDRLEEYSQMGARFAKWRAVLIIGEGIPSRGCIEANAMAPARYAALCQEAGIVPIVEPEVLMDGGHTLEQCRKVTEEVLRTVFDQLFTQGVSLEGMILKPGTVLPGANCPKQETVEEVAAASRGRHLSYSAGVMLLSKESPSFVRYRSAEPVLSPVLHEERRGTVANVVFPTGIDQRNYLGDPDRFDIYYGMADNRIGVARLNLPEHLPEGARNPQ